MVRDACRGDPMDLETGGLYSVGYLCCRCCGPCSRCRRGRRSDQEALLIVTLRRRGGAFWFDDNGRKSLLIVTSDGFELTSCS